MFLRIFHSYTLWKMKIDLICCAKRKSKWGMEFISVYFFFKKNLFDSLIACITTAKRTFYISPTRMITFFVEIVFGCSRFAKNWKFNKKNLAKRMSNHYYCQTQQKIFERQKNEQFFFIYTSLRFRPFRLCVADQFIILSSFPNQSLLSVVRVCVCVSLTKVCRGTFAFEMHLTMDIAQYNPHTHT